jgi:hypothetical protein
MEEGAVAKGHRALRHSTERPLWRKASRGQSSRHAAVLIERVDDDLGKQRCLTLPRNLFI